jgi:hypothetical protein
VRAESTLCSIYLAVNIEYNERTPKTIAASFNG